MPNRILRDWTDSETMDKLTVHAERFFTRLIMKVDDYGRFSANIRVLKNSLFILKDNIREADISCWMAECQKIGLILLYETNQKQYLQINNFKQVLRQKVEKYPSPDKCITLDKHMHSISNTSASLKGNEVELEVESENNTPNGVSSTSSPARQLPSILKDDLKEEWILVCKEISESTDSTTQKKLLQKFIVLKKPNFIEPYATAWNMMASEHDFSEIKINGLSGKRMDQLKTRLKESAFDFMRIMWSIPRNPKYKEAIGDKNWKVDFDYVIKNDTNYLKIIEGVPNRDAYDLMIHKMLG